MKILISNASDSPLYEQIKEQIKDAILKEELKEGDALPSIRAFANDLKVSVLTIRRVYEELERLALPESWKFRKPSRETKNTVTPILERYIHTIFRKQVIDFNSESGPFAVASMIVNSFSSIELSNLSMCWRQSLSLFCLSG